MEVRASNIDGLRIFQMIELEMGHIVQSLFENATLNEFSKTPWLVPNYVTVEGRMRALSQSFVVLCKDRVVVVDTCVGNDKDILNLPEWTRMQTDFIAMFDTIGLNPDQVTDVLCTHLHADHVGWNTRLEPGGWSPTFPNAKYYFSRLEYDYIAGGGVGVVDDTKRAFTQSVQPVVDAGLAVFVELDEDLGDGISFVPTPGHTIGHVSVRFTTDSGYLFVSGDAIHHPCQIARTDWSTTVDRDPEQAARSRRQLLSLSSENGAFLAGTHFAIPSIGRVAPAQDGEYVFHPCPCAPALKSR